MKWCSFIWWSEGRNFTLVLANGTERAMYTCKAPTHSAPNVLIQQKKLPSWSTPGDVCYLWKIGKGVTNFGGIMFETNCGLLDYKVSRSHSQCLLPLWCAKKNKKWINLLSFCLGVTDFSSIVTRCIGSVLYCDTRNTPRMYSDTEIQVLIDKLYCDTVI